MEKRWRFASLHCWRGAVQATCQAACQARCAVAAMAASMIIGASASALPPIHDWNYRLFPDAGETGIAPIAWPSFPIAPDDKIYADWYEEIIDLDLPVGVLLIAQTSPTDFATIDPEALPVMMDWIPTLDFVYCDLEGPNREVEMLAIIDTVRTHPNNGANQARIGNYAYYPGNFDYSAPFPSQAQRILRSWFYLGNDLTVAQPHLYPYTVYAVHTSDFVWGADIAPNVRSAMYWAPIERMSVAKRELPVGDLLVPYVNVGIVSEGYEHPLPPREDWFSILVHYRLRGIDGYYTWITLLDDYTSPEYRRDMHNVWQTLDCFFNNDDVEILNLDTDKNSGMQWSGGRNGNEFVFIVSNLGETPASVDFPGGLPGVPNASPVVQPGTHVLLTYPDDVLDACNTDCDDNGWPDAIDIAIDPGLDCNGNGLPDGCDLLQDPDCNSNGIPDSCDTDCNENGTPDSCDMDDGTAADCDGNGVPDSCDIASGTADCDGDGVPDSCGLAEDDCNSNGVLDACDIDAGDSNDVNGNGLPDECEEIPCPADANNDGGVDVDDLVAVILAWGTNDPQADVTADGIVDVDDLVELIVNWGPCP